MVDRTMAGKWSGGRAPATVGLLGHRRGGGTGIITAAEHRGVAALVTWAAVSTFQRWGEEHIGDWTTRGVTYIANARTGQQMPLYRTLWDDLQANADRLDVTAAAAMVRVPWLIVHGEEDATVPVAEARRLNEAGASSALRVISGSGHTFEAAHPDGGYDTRARGRGRGHAGALPRVAVARWHRGRASGAQGCGFNPLPQSLQSVD